MDAVELKLFELKKDSNSTVKSAQNLLVEEVKPTSNRIDVYDKINHFFNESDSDVKAIEQARQILGDDAKTLRTEQIQDLLSNIDYLVNSWIEEFERSVFDGKTFNELIQASDK